MLGVFHSSEKYFNLLSVWIIGVVKCFEVFFKFFVGELSIVIVKMGDDLKRGDIGESIKMVFETIDVYSTGRDKETGDIVLSFDAFLKVCFFLFVSPDDVSFCNLGGVWQDNGNWSRVLRTNPSWCTVGALIPILSVGATD